MVINVKEYFSDIWDGCRAQPNELFSSGATNQKIGQTSSDKSISLPYIWQCKSKNIFQFSYIWEIIC